MNRPNPGWTTPAIVERVIDGDTIEVEVRRTLRVRLCDVWAPESRTRDTEEKARGLAAKANLESMLPVGSEVTLHVPTSESGDLAEAITLGRVLGYVWVDDGKSVNERQVESGHATTTKRGS